MIIINGLPGTGKTSFCNLLVNNYGYKYFNDWDFFEKNNIIIDKLENKSSISSKFSKLISNFIVKNKDTKIVFDLEYSISPNDFMKHGLHNIAQCFYFGFTSLSNETLFNLFRQSSANNHDSDDLLKRKIAFYKKSSLEYQEQCKHHNLLFVDICKDRNIIFNEIIKGLNNL